MKNELYGRVKMHKRNWMLPKDGIDEHDVFTAQREAETELHAQTSSLSISVFTHKSFPII